MKVEAELPPRTRPSVVELESELPPSAPEPLVKRLGRVALGRQPIGLAFGAPYALFIAVLFAYPLGLSVWISFHSYFFTAPGMSVARPFVGFANYRAVLSDPAVRQSLLNILIFLVINVPLTVGLSMLLASASAAINKLVASNSSP